MLANDRFNWETPNVIDPGEKPPLRPSRLEATNHRPGGSTGGSTDESYPSGGSFGRNKYRKPQSSTLISSNRQKISLDTGDRYSHLDIGGTGHQPFRFVGERQRSSMSLSDVENDDDDDLYPPTEDDAEFGVSHKSGRFQEQSNYFRSSGTDHDQLPSVEQARLFAASVLQESECRNSKRHLFGKKKSVASLFPNRRTAETAPLSGFPSPKFRTIAFADDQRRRCCTDTGTCKRMFHRLLCLAAFVVLSVGVYAAVNAVGTAIRRNNRRNDSGSGPSHEITPRMQSIIDFLKTRTVSYTEALADPASPQYQAARWLANEDPYQVIVPTADNADADLDVGNRFLQRYIVTVFYYATNGAEWDKQLNFLTQDHECNWFETTTDENDVPYGLGVTCNPELQVDSILMPSNKLMGTITPELYHLSHLAMLDIKHNNIIGKLPDPQSAVQGSDEALGQLDVADTWSKLEYLDLKGNQISGTIPDGLFQQTTSLQILGLSRNVFSGPIPPSVASLTALKTLALDQNLLTGDITGMQFSPTIEYLYLSHNILSGNLDVVLNGSAGNRPEASKLLELDLSFNQFTCEYFPKHFLEEHSELKVLDLSNNQELKGNLPNELSITSSQLRFLSLRNNQFDGIISNSFVTPLTSLLHLDLEGNELSGPINSSIGAACERLQYLFLGQNDFVKGDIPVQLKELHDLREVSLDSTNRVGVIPDWVNTDWTELRILDLANNELEGTIPDMQNLKELRYAMFQKNKLSGSDIPPTIGGENLSVLALHRNIDLRGSLDEHYCKLDSLATVTADCESVQCSCCTEQSCCEDEDCFREYDFDQLEHVDAHWTDGFQRSEYSFNPKILRQDESTVGD